MDAYSAWSPLTVQRTFATARSGIAGTPGVVTADSGPEALGAVRQLLATRRVWQRFPASVARQSAVS